MKYELILIAEKGAVGPDWEPGMDRLAHYSPYPGARAMLEENIATGALSRYVEHDDHLEITDTDIRIHTVYNTLEGAQKMYNYFSQYPNAISLDIVERPEL